VYKSQFRQGWAKMRVANNCFGGENPVMHVEHPPHMLSAAGQQLEDDALAAEAEEERRNNLYDADERAERVLLDKAQGRSRRWEVVLSIPKRRKEDARLENQARVIDVTADRDSLGPDPEDDVATEDLEQEANAGLANPEVESDDGGGRLAAETQATNVDTGDIKVNEKTAIDGDIDDTLAVVPCTENAETDAGDVNAPGFSSLEEDQLTSGPFNEIDIQAFLEKSTQPLHAEAESVTEIILDHQETAGTSAGSSHEGAASARKDGNADDALAELDHGQRPQANQAPGGAVADAALSPKSDDIHLRDDKEVEELARIEEDALVEDHLESTAASPAPVPNSAIEVDQPLANTFDHLADGVTAENIRELAIDVEEPTVQEYGAEETALGQMNVVDITEATNVAITTEGVDLDVTALEHADTADQTDGQEHDRSAVTPVPVGNQEQVEEERLA